MKKVLIIIWSICLFDVFCVDKNELLAFKADAQKFSKGINNKVATGKKVSKDDSTLFVKSSNENLLVSSKTKEKKDSKPSFFDSLFGSKKNNDKINLKEKNNKKDTKKSDEYSDPFGDLDANLFDTVGKTKKKSEVKQANTDKKKEAAKIKEKKEQQKKEESGFFASLGAALKSGAKSIAKSDLGKEVGNTLKKASVGVVSNAVNLGTEKINDGINSLNNKIIENKTEVSVSDLKNEDNKDVLAIAEENDLVADENELLIKTNEDEKESIKKSEELTATDLHQVSKKSVEQGEQKSALPVSSSGLVSKSGNTRKGSKKTKKAKSKRKKNI